MPRAEPDPDPAWSVPLAAVLLALAVAATGPTAAAIPAVYLALVTPRLALVDVREHRLPNPTVAPGYLAVLAGVLGQWAGNPVPVVAIVAVPVVLAVLAPLGLTGALGMGDVKLAGVLAGASGLIGAEAIMVCAVAGLIVGGAAALAVVARSRDRAARIAFGPALLAGYWIAIAANVVAPRAG